MKSNRIDNPPFLLGVPTSGLVVGVGHWGLLLWKPAKLRAAAFARRVDGYLFVKTVARRLKEEARFAGGTTRPERATMAPESIAA